jgi:DNA repair ATPase RecN
LKEIELAIRTTMAEMEHRLLKTMDKLTGQLTDQINSLETQARDTANRIELSRDPIRSDIRALLTREFEDFKMQQRTASRIAAFDPRALGPYQIYHGRVPSPVAQ